MTPLPPWSEPAPPQRLRGAVAKAAARGLIALVCVGCTHHVRAPTPDRLGTAPVPPAPRDSELLVAARLSYGTLSALVDAARVAPYTTGQRSPLATWRLSAQQLPGAVVRSDANRVCVQVPFAGAGLIELMGRSLKRTVQAQVEVCATPRLNPDAVLSLRDPAVRVTTEAGRVALNSRVLVTALSGWLNDKAGPAVARRLTTLRVPLRPKLAPLAERLTRIVDLGQGACLRPRASEIIVGQPAVEPHALRFAAVIRGRPSVELPCGRDLRPPSAPHVAAALTVEQRPTRLSFPVAVSLATARAALLKALAKPIRWRGGAVRVTDVTLTTSAGAVLARLHIDGHATTRVWGIESRRDVRGEVLIWGRPTIRDGRAGLTDVRLVVELDDALAELGVALRRSALQTTVARHLSLPTRTVTQRAQALVARLGAALKVKGVPVPVRVDTRRLQATAARALPGWLVVDVDFEGWVVLAPGTSAPRTSAPSRPLR